MADGRELLAFHDAAIAGRTVAFSPDGGELIVGGYFHAVLVYDVRSKALIRTLPAYEPGRPGKILEGCELRLMSSLKDIGKIPETGRNEIILADVAGWLHVRFFDSGGNLIADTDEREMGAGFNRASLRELKNRIGGLVPPQELVEGEKTRLIAELSRLANVGVQRKRREQPPRPSVGETAAHVNSIGFSADGKTLVRTTRDFPVLASWTETLARDAAADYIPDEKTCRELAEADSVESRRFGGIVLASTSGERPAPGKSVAAGSHPLIKKGPMPPPGPGSNRLPPGRISPLYAEFDSGILRIFNGS